MRRGGVRGLGLLDLLVILALMALLVYLVRLDWQPSHRPVAKPASTTIPPAS